MLRSTIAILLALLCFAGTAEAQTSATNRELRQALTANGRWGVPGWATASLPTCNSGNERAVAYDLTLDTLVVCNGTAWGFYVGSPTFSGGTLTLGSTSVAGTISVPFTATGGVDAPLFVDFTSDFASADNIITIRDAVGTSAVSLFTFGGTGTFTALANIVAGGSVFPNTSSNTRITAPNNGGLYVTNAAVTDYTSYVFATTAKTLTESSATDVVSIGIAAGSGSGGEFEYAIYAADATNHQIRAGTVTWAAVNEAGTEACALGTPVEADGTPTGTLTVTVTCVDGGTNLVKIQLNAVSSLTQTTLNVKWQLRKNHGTGVITPL
jgi:hypothetical protein